MGTPLRQTPRKAFGVLALLLAAPGCSSLWQLRSEHREIASLRAASAPQDPSQELVPLRCVFHVHSKYSHDSEGRIEDIARAAKRNGIAAVFLTDHTNPRIFTDCPSGWIDGVWFVRGEEISIKGSLLGLGTRSCIGKTTQSPQAIVDEIEAQGGLCCVSHLERTDPYKIHGYEAVGIHNLHADAQRVPLLDYPGILLDVLFYRHRYGPELVLRDVLRAPRKQLRTWDKLLQTRRVTAISEADAHENLRVLGMQIDPYELILGVEHTYLMVPREWTQADLLDAIRQGRAYVGLTMVADPRGFSFALARDGWPAGSIGDEVTFEAGLTAVVRCPAPGRIVILRDGKPIATARGRELAAPCSAAGVYRAEVWVKVGGRELPWILANPIYVRAPDPDGLASNGAVGPRAAQREPARDSASR